MGHPRLIAILVALGACAPAASAPPLTTAEVLAQSAPEEWREIPADRLLVMDIEAGRVLLELAPEFAPEHVGNIRTLARQGHWDGLAILRVQDNYVVQWGDPNADKPEARRGLGQAKTSLPAEFDRAVDGLPIEALLDPDAYADRTGFSLGFPVGREADNRRTWLLHCYGTLGAGRDMAADSSTGAELYVVTGHSPRHLDRNITTVGRVIEGIEKLSALPRGTGALGFYTDPTQHVPIRRIRLAADLPETERPRRERLDTHSRSFRLLIEARRHRHEDWFVNPVGRLEACNVPLPVREAGQR